MEGAIVDVLFVNPGSAAGIYQALSRDWAAIEPPTWALILAESARTWGASVGILDANAERLSFLDAAQRINELQPRLTCFVTYGQNVNAGIVSMSGASRTAEALRGLGFRGAVAVVGSYAQAEPVAALRNEPAIDFAFTNEGVLALKEILFLTKLSSDELEGVAGLAIRRKNGEVLQTRAGQIVPNGRLEVEMPGYAWDLLPKAKTPFDLYRSPLWHAGYIENQRSPYAAIQTSLGCNFSCNFCMINMINRTDTDELGIASNYKSMRFWSPEFALKQIDNLSEYGVRTIRITDEMFLLNRRYYLPLCEQLAGRSYSPDLRMWAYSRIDTVPSPEVLETIRTAGIRWLALGIETASREVRLEVSKGKFSDVDVNRAIQQVEAADIDVMANYIVGLPGDTKATMNATLALSLDLCTSGWNMYPAMALPGSELYADARARGIEVPSTYEAYSFHSFETLPLPNGQLTAPEILEFRDRAFDTYHSNPQWLQHIRGRFGDRAVDNVTRMASVKLHRKILGHLAPMA